MLPTLPDFTSFRYSSRNEGPVTAQSLVKRVICPIFSSTDISCRRESINRSFPGSVCDPAGCAFATALPKRRLIMIHNLIVRLVYNSKKFSKLKSQSLKPFLNFRSLHKQPPEQAAAVVFDHHRDRPLVDGQVSLRKPVFFNTKGIIKTIFSQVVIKMPDYLHAFVWGIGKGG